MKKETRIVHEEITSCFGLDGNGCPWNHNSYCSKYKIHLHPHTDNDLFGFPGICELPKLKDGKQKTSDEEK